MNLQNVPLHHVKIRSGVYKYRGWLIERKEWKLPREINWYATKGDEEDEYDTLREAKDWIDTLEKETNS